MVFFKPKKEDCENEFITMLIDFLELPAKDRWFEFSDFTFLIRKGTRRIFIDSIQLNLRCLVISNIKVNLAYKNKGMFNYILGIIEEKILDRGYEGIYVDSVSDFSLGSIFINEGYREDIKKNNILSFVKHVFKGSNNGTGSKTKRNLGFRNEFQKGFRRVCFIRA